jgi:predicted nucleic acid-binding protein
MQFFDETILIDTSAAIALLNPQDQFHHLAHSFLDLSKNYVWVVLNSTKHESFTRTRYDYDFNNALRIYDYLSSEPIQQIYFTRADEVEAINILKRYQEHKLSFHDALCAAVMKKYGIYKAFTFDKHFYYFGFEVYPGIYL